mgnify:CR=1 FL=1|jgi:hypothetical protein
MKKKLYVGCALTNLSPDRKVEFLSMIRQVKNTLKEYFEVMEFLGVDDASQASPREVYNFDIKECVMKADYMLAICDYPSLGLGYEISTAVEKRGIPVLAMAHRDSEVTRLIRGIDNPEFNFEIYNSIEDIINTTKAKFLG